MDRPSSEQPDRLDLLRKRRDELRRMKSQLHGMLSDLDVLIAEAEQGHESGSSPHVRDAEDAREVFEPATPGRLRASTATAAENPREKAQPRSSGKPLRAIVLDALEDIEWPTYSRELAQFCSAWMGRVIHPERFGSLANDEMKSFQRALDGARVRPVWLCFALTHDRHQPIKRLWARSDWPLERRIFSPTSGRVQHLKLTAKLCELAQRDAAAADPEMMRIIAADHARDLPGAPVQRGKFRLDAWRQTALELLKELEPRDAETRAQSAARLRERGPFTQLFGVPEAEEIDRVLPQHEQRRG